MPTVNFVGIFFFRKHFNSPEMHYDVYNLYEPNWKGLQPESSEKIRKGNYKRIFGQARQKVRNWEKANVN